MYISSHKHSYLSILSNLKTNWLISMLIHVYYLHVHFFHGVLPTHVYSYSDEVMGTVEEVECLLDRERLAAT